MVLVASLILISYFEPELFLQNIRSIVIKRYFGILIIDPLLDLMERLKSLDYTNKSLYFEPKITAEMIIFWKKNAGLLNRIDNLIRIKYSLLFT